MTHTDDARGRHVHDPAELHNAEVAHEHSDVNVRGILMFLAGLVVVAAVVFILMALMFRWLESEAQANDPQLSPLAAAPTDMPRTTTETPFFGPQRGGAQLLTNEYLALEQHRAEENKRLGGFGWVEGQPGVAHMPIDEAKKLILERGVPVRAGEPPAAHVGTRAAANGESSGGRTVPTGTQPPKLPAGGAPGTGEPPAGTPAPQPSHGAHGPSGH